MRTNYQEGDSITEEDVGLVFRSRNGEQWKILCILYEDFIPVVAVNSKNTIVKKFNGDGQDGFRQTLIAPRDLDLVSFVGSYFEEDKKHRKFEFDCELIEKQSEIYSDKSLCQNITSKNIGHSCSGLSNVGRYSKECLNNDEKISKWKITMEELLDE